MFRELEQLPVPREHLKETSNAKEFVENKASKKFDRDKRERVRKRVSSEVQDVNVKRIRLQH